MKQSEFKKATQLFHQIKSIDEQIKEIDKLALLIANKETKCTFQFKVEDIVKKEEEANKVEFDEDGSIRLRASSPGSSYFEAIMGMGWGISSNSPKKNPNEHIYKPELTPTEAMKILSVLLFEKQRQRNILVDSIKKLGVEI